MNLLDRWDTSLQSNQVNFLMTEMEQICIQPGALGGFSRKLGFYVLDTAFTTKLNSRAMAWSCE